MILRLLLSLVTFLTLTSLTDGRVVRTQLVRASDFNTEITNAWIRNIDYALAKCPRLVPAADCADPQNMGGLSFYGLQFPTIGPERYNIYQYLDVPAAGNGTLSFDFVSFDLQNGVYHARVDCAIDFTFEIRIGNDVYFHFNKNTPNVLNLPEWDSSLARYSYPVTFTEPGQKILSISFTKDHYGHFTDYCDGRITLDNMVIDYEYVDPIYCDCECPKVEQGYSILESNL